MSDALANVPTRFQKMRIFGQCAEIECMNTALNQGRGVAGCGDRYPRRGRDAARAWSNESPLQCLQVCDESVRGEAPITRLRDVLISAYFRGFRESEIEAHRLVAMAIIDAALGVESMGTAPIDILRQAKSALAAGPLSADAADGYSDQLHAYLVEKNGQAVVQKDREDKAIRAAFEAFHSSVDYSGVEGMAVETESLLTGEAGDIL